MFKNALVSVANKEGLVDFIRPLSKQGMRVVSTGGTASLLKKAGIPVTEVKEQTGFAEVMDGRVKSLHPYIHMPLLARKSNQSDQQILEKAKLSPFDLLVCNLYPFEEKMRSEEKNLVEWIDVGGSSLLRAGAKNFEQVCVLCDPTDYPSVLNAKTVPQLEERKRLAGKAFSLLARYDTCVASWMGKSWKENGDLCLLASFSQSLRYGENPDQKSAWFQLNHSGIHQAHCLQGKKLSLNNVRDLDSAVLLIRKFTEPACAIIKHSNPCGLAQAKDLESAVDRALKADPVSAFGGIVAVNHEIDSDTAKRLSSLFLEAIISPCYSSSALEIFRSKKNLHVIQWPEMLHPSNNSMKVQSVDGGLLVQEEQKLVDSWQNSWKQIGQKPTASIQSDLLMAWKVCAHLKSNAIALVAQQQTLGLSMGQVSRVSAVESSIKNWKLFHPQAPIPVLASDGFFPFPDAIQIAEKSGIKWIIQPGGSIRDEEITSTAQNLSINMIFTGQRCFLH